MLSRLDQSGQTSDQYAGVRIVRMVDNAPRKRIIVKRGKEYILLKCEQVVMVYTESKIVYVIDQEGKRYMHEDNLANVIQYLDPEQFFRVNRQYILNIGFIKSFKSYEKVKLQVSLIVPELTHHTIIVSQEMAPDFRNWVGK